MKILNFSTERKLINITDNKDFKENNFTFIRFIAVMLVVISHSFPLSYGDNTQEPLKSIIGSETLGGVGVYIFFLLSGFLNIISFQNSNDVLNYIKKRVLRIYPSLAVCVLLTVFLMGPFLTKNSIMEYFLNINTYKYLLSTSVFYISFSLPGVFENNPYGAAVNGSLWMLKYMIICYLFIIILNSIKLLKGWPVLLLTVISLIAVTMLDAFGVPMTGAVFHIYYLVKFFIFFGIGVCFYFFRNRIFFDLKLFILSALIVFASVSVFSKLFIPCLALFGSYCILYFSFLKIKKIYQFGTYGDYSYGIYIFSFPIQQIFIQIFSDYREWWFNSLVSTPVIIIFAFLSWHLIEKRILALKRRI